MINVICIHDSKLCELCETFVILKSDKGQGTVLLDHGDYVNSMQGIFDDASKFKKIAKDPTITRLTTVQSFLKTLCKRKQLLNLKRKRCNPDLHK